eukprot:m51a1_g14510 hypothetical protein (209) ;mRNA; f:830125-831008
MATTTTARKLGPRDYRDMPWKNGGGVTRELLRLAHPSGDAGRFVARLSVATVASAGPFSAFPGVDRVLMILEGAGVALDFGAAPGVPEVTLDAPLKPVWFPGEAPVQCRLLGGAVRDFNLMTDRSLAGVTSFRVCRLSASPGPCGAASVPAPAWRAFAHVLSGAADVGAHRVAAEETLVLEDVAEPVEIRSAGPEGATVVVMTLCSRP